MLAKETAAAVLSELARSQASFRGAIVNAGGIHPLIELMKGESSGAKKQATCAIWGLTSEARYRKAVVHVPGAVERLVELLRNNEGETQGFAAATLVNLAGDEDGKQMIASVGGAGPLMTIALGPDNWLRTQCVHALKLLGYADPCKKADAASPPQSPRLMKFRAELAAHPAIWMVTEDEIRPQPIVNAEHMADLACKIKLGQRVIVDPGDRKAMIMFVGKIPEIAAGYWIGVQFDEPVGKNDGSIKGQRCFECPPDHGGFLRPNHIRHDPSPPPPPRAKAESGELNDNTDQPASEDPMNARARRPSASASPGSAAAFTGTDVPAAHKADTNGGNNLRPPTARGQTLDGPA